MKKIKSLPVEEGHEAYAILSEIRDAHHDHLAAAKIALVWMVEPRKSKGKTVLATCRIVPELYHRLTEVDLVVELLHPWWAAADGDSKRYLIDHELCHAAPKLDQDGHQEMDDTGRKIWSSVPHDIEDFAGPVARWGAQPDLERFLVGAQLSLPMAEDSVDRVMTELSSDDGMARMARAMGPGATAKKTPRGLQVTVDTDAN